MSSALFLVALTSLGVPGGVVLNEIHYHPPAGDEKALEFVEIHNAGARAVPIAGWRLAGAVRFTFPEGAALPAGGHAVVCRDLDLFRRSFPDVAQAGLYGDFDGTLENAGEEVLLTDQFNAYVDALRYDDRAPWPEDADGGGPSLQRVCASAPSEDARNWSGEHFPTPLAANGASLCPLPAPEPPRVVISEVFYHPPRPAGFHPAGDDGEALEFLELLNPGPAPVNLRGWRFTLGIGFEFPAATDTILLPDERLVVCRDQAAVRAAFGITNTTGNYRGVLSNSGERLTLVDAAGAVVDSLEYDEEGEWPYAADGEGRSLEKVAPLSPADDPSSWASSGAPGAFERLVVEGPLRGAPTERILILADGAGEFIIDNVVLEKTSEPGVNLVAGGDFEVDPFAGSPAGGAWERNGTGATSRWDAAAGVGGSGAVRFISSGSCTATADCVLFPCTTLDGVRYTFRDADRSATYRLSMDVRFVAGRRAAFRAGVFEATIAGLEALASPGREGSRAADGAPPRLSHLRRFPEEPRSSDATWITARVSPRGAPPGAVTATLLHNGGVFGAEPSVSLAMLDDGLHRDGGAGDGVYGAELPRFLHDTQVRFRVRAMEGERAAISPRLQDEAAPLGHEVWGFYVNDLQPGSELPIFHILLHDERGGRIDPNDIALVNRHLECASQILKPGSLAFQGELYPDVGVRWRGNAMCGVLKRNFKVKMNRGRLFQGVRKLNLNSLWTDKALVREHLSWRLLDELALPYHETEYARVHLNGIYFGLYLCLEHPDHRFLERNGLDGGGNLYKSLQPTGSEPVGVRQTDPGGYCRLWEEETNEGGDYADVEELIGAMHADGAQPGPPSVAFWRGRSLEDLILEYQVGQVILNNIDSFAKNHFLYHDLEADRWGFLTWDLDLTFGKFFSPFDACGRPGILNDLLLCRRGPPSCPVPDQLDPWFASTVSSPVVFNWLVDFFLRAGGSYYHRALLTRIWDILEEKYTNESYDPQLDELAIRLAEEQALDIARWGRYTSNVEGFPADMLSNIEVIKDQIDCHRDFLVQFIEKRHPEIPRHPRVKITEIMYQPLGGDQNLEYLELVNLSDAAVDLSLWSFADGIEFTFRQGTSVGPGEVFLVASSPEDLLQRFPSIQAQVFGPYAGRLADEGETIRLRDGVPGVLADHPATIDVVKYDADGAWPELLPGESLELTDVSRSRDNDRAAHWAPSPPGGTPGATGPAFVRGDANDDRALNLTDGVFILNFLFLSGAAPACLDAADTNDDARLNLTDGVYLLNHLFLEGPAPPAPFPVRGGDPTPDGIACGAG
jgi:hypothetical protein